MTVVTACSPFGKLYKERSRVTLALPANRQPAAVSAVKNDSGNPPPALMFTFVSATGDSVPVGISVEWDSLSNENVTTMKLNEVVVTAGSTRNTAERNGLINLEFVVTVPKLLQDDNWMVNVRPVLMRGDIPDSLKELRFTGLQFREAQERAYRRYDRFLGKIIPDSVYFGQSYVNHHAFELYLARLQWYKHGLEKRRVVQEAKMNRIDPLLERFALFNRQVAGRDSLMREYALKNSRRMLERQKWQSDRALARMNDSSRHQVKTLRERSRYFDRKREDRGTHYTGGVSMRANSSRSEFLNRRMERMNASLSRRSGSMRAGVDGRDEGVKYLRSLLVARNADLRKADRADSTGKHIRHRGKIRDLPRPEKGGLSAPRKPGSTFNRFDSAATVRHYMDRYERLRSRLPAYHLTRELVNIHSHAQRHAMLEAKYREGIDRINSLDSTTLMKRFYNTREILRNEARKAAKDDKFRDLVRFPYNPTAKLDTIIYGVDKVQFLYSEKVPADENSAHMKVYVVGDVVDRNGSKYALPKSDTLTYLVSSMTKFIDKTPRFLQKIVTRDAEANTSVNFSFPQNLFKLDETNAVNRQGVKKVKDLTLALMTDPVYIIDSLTLFATSSPEGAWKSNGVLARKRAESIREVLARDFTRLYDSLVVASSIEMDEAGNAVRREVKNEIPDLPNLIKVRTVPEDWDKLRRLILADANFKGDKGGVLRIIDEEQDPDRREWMIKRRHKAEYTYMFDKLYPVMRAVDFRFSLSRKGMKQDTLYTNEPDTAYARAIEWLEKRKYEKALDILRPYEDVNTGIAYMSLGYDKAALRVLEKCPQEAGTIYMEAILNARLGMEQKAVLFLLRAAEMDRMMQSRANLDPELSALVKKYKLFEEDDFP